METSWKTKSVIPGSHMLFDNRNVVSIFDKLLLAVLLLLQSDDSVNDNYHMKNTVIPFAGN